MSDVTALLVETADRLFQDHVTPQVLSGTDRGEWPDDLWRAVAETGLDRALLSAEGGSLADAMAVLRVAGRHAAPIPLAETMLAGWLLEAAAQTVPPGPLTVAPVNDADTIRVARGDGGDCRLTGVLRRVPWARQAEAIVIVGEPQSGGPAAAIIAPANAHIAHGQNLAGEPRDDVTLENAEGRALDCPAAIDRDVLLRRGALARAALISGGLDHALAATIQYAGERVQFGRPIGKFQAIQHHLAALAGHAAASSAALSAAVASESHFDVAVVKARASEAAGEAAAIAHQVHGAIGFTEEHSLHHTTKRLWAWRDEFGSEAHWHAALGKAVAAAGADGLWPMITAA